jgi:hypothetical protein
VLTNASKPRYPANTPAGRRIIRTLRFQCSLASGTKRKQLKAELTYFRNQQARMHYPDYIRRNLPIASGVMEASPLAR